MLKRHGFQTLRSRLTEKRRFMQIVTGPRQSGKTTLIHQVLTSLPIPHIYASADEPSLKDVHWLEQQWNTARVTAKTSESILVVDEIQKVTGWSEMVKRLWDEDTWNKVRLQVALTGSAPLLLQKGITESLAGRFELIRLPHWSYPEMKEAFDWSLDTYLFFGGYPGAAELVKDETRWRRYILDSIVETTISRDVLLLQRIDKPALLRRLFQLGCDYSGQILSFQKMMGQLQDAGNTTTLAHYLELLSQCGLINGLQKYSGKKIRQRSSSPKLLVQNTALMTASTTLSFQKGHRESEFWGRLVESAMGAHLWNTSRDHPIELYYWRHANQEVDFVLQEGKKIVAIEVKSGRKKDTQPGMKVFEALWKPGKKLLVGSGGIPLEKFLHHPASYWLE